MKKFYEDVAATIQEIRNDDALDKQVAKVYAAGPVVTVEVKHYNETRQVRDKIDNILKKKKIESMNNYVAGGPIKDLVERFPRACYGVINDYIKDIRSPQYGKIVTWWPERVSKPDFSLHLNGFCIFSAAADTDEMVMTLCIRKDGLQGVLRHAKKDGPSSSDLEFSLNRNLANVEMMYATEVCYNPDPAAMGKKTKGY